MILLILENGCYGFLYDLSELGRRGISIAIFNCVPHYCQGEPIGITPGILEKWVPSEPIFPCEPTHPSSLLSINILKLFKSIPGRVYSFLTTGIPSRNSSFTTHHQRSPKYGWIPLDQLGTKLSLSTGKLRIIGEPPVKHLSPRHPSIAKA